jgi:hypothetical protein
MAAELTPTQQRVRGRVEALIGLAAPALDLVLAVGERISRIAEPEDTGYYPVRSGGEAFLRESAVRSPREAEGSGQPSAARSE